MENCKVSALLGTTTFKFILYLQYIFLNIIFMCGILRYTFMLQVKGRNMERCKLLIGLVIKTATEGEHYNECAKLTLCICY